MLKSVFGRDMCAQSSRPTRQAELGKDSKVEELTCLQTDLASRESQTMHPETSELSDESQSTRIPRS